MKLGDVTFVLKGDPTEWKGTLSAVESDAKGVGGRISQTLKEAFSPANMAKGFAQGLGIGVGLEVWQKLGEGIRSVADAIPSLIERGQQYALTVEEMTKRTGASAEASSKLVSTLTFLGIPTDGLGQKLSMMARQVLASEQTFKDLGIATRDANGEFLDGVAILDNVRQRYQSLGSGIEKAALAQVLLSRGGGSLLEYLNLSNAQVAMLEAAWTRLGLVLDEAGVQRAEDVERETNLLKLAMTALGQRLFQDVAPAIISVTQAFIELVDKYGPQIEAFFRNAVTWVSGLIEGLTGIDMSGIKSFVTNFNTLKDSIGSATDAQKKQTTATGNQTAAIDRQIQKLTDLDRAQERTYRRGIALLTAELDAQLRLLDAQDRARADAETDARNAEALKQAQMGMVQAQARLAQARASGSEDAGAAEIALAEAMQRVREVQRQIADEAIRRQEQTRRDQIQSVKDFISEIDRLVSDATGSPAFAKQDLATLEARRKALLAQGAKTAAKGSDLNIEYRAVEAGIARIQQIIKNGTSRAALDAQKSAAAVGKAITDVNNQITKTATIAARTLHQIAPEVDRAGKSVSGGMVSAFESGKQAADRLRQSLQLVLDVLVGRDGKGGIIGAIATLAGMIGRVLPFFTVLGEIIRGMSPGLRLTEQLDKNNPLSPYLTQRTPTAPTVTMTDSATGTNTTGYVVTSGSTRLQGKASGGPIFGGTPYLVGERGPELFVPRMSGSIVPNAGLGSIFGQQVAAAAGMGGSPAIVRIEVGGNRLFDYIDRNLAYRRR